MLEQYLINPLNFEEENILIGEGNFGQVTLVHPKNDCDTKIALKRIPVDLDDNSLQKNFIREVSVMASLDHPNILKLVGFSLPSKEDQTLKIYSKYLPNQTLIQVLREDESSLQINKKLNPTQKTIIIYGIASAMEYLHSKNIVHRDLKPENVFLDENFYPVLSDFGFSRFFDDDIYMTGRLGTPYFMAPELFVIEDEKLTNKIDVYAFAVTLLSMFTTKYEFEGIQPKNISQLISKIKKGRRYTIPKEVPECYVRLIERCWLNDPVERPSFENIVNNFFESDEYILPGADKEKVHEYVQLIKNFNDSKKINKYQKCSFLLPEEIDLDEDGEETQEFDFSY